MASSEVFNTAHNFVLKWEGGLCDDPADAGGITKYGVSLRFLQNIKPDATRYDIINMTKAEAKALFKKHFWDRCRCAEMPDKTAFILYDTAVNVGCKQAVKFLQRAVGTFVDGLIGPKTIKAACTVNDNPEVLDNFLHQREVFYENLAKNKPSQKVFLKGWLNRTKDLRKQIKEYKNESSTS